MKSFAFEIARKVNKVARNEVLASVDKSAYKAVVKEKGSGKKKNTATSLFEKTGGQHQLLLDHERKEMEKKEDIEKEQEEQEIQKEERKRKRKEDEERKEERKRQRKERKEEEIKHLEESKCQADGCRFRYNKGNVRAPKWFFCPCKKFCVCPTHKIHDFFEQKKKEHLENCQKE